MIKYFVISLPYTGTTYTYKYLYARYKLLGVFEPFNPEPVLQILSGVRYTHYRVGWVPYDYDKLPDILVRVIRENCKWLYDWLKGKRNTPYLGWRWKEVLLMLHDLDEEVLVKDVYAWIRFNEIYELLDTKFVVPIPTKERLLAGIELKYKGIRRMLKVYDLFSEYFGFKVEDTLESYKERVSKLYDIWMDMIKDKDVKILRWKDKLEIREDI